MLLAFSRRTTNERPDPAARHVTRSCLGQLLVALAMLSLASAPARAQFVIGQTPGTDYLAFEAEDFDSLTNGADDTGFVTVTVADPFTTDFGSTVLPDSTNAGRGEALYDQPGGSDQDLANYKLQFAEPGPYYLYLHYTMFERTDPTGYGNEDSFFIPREFGVSPAGPRGDNNWWISLPGLGSAPGDGVMEGNFHWWRTVEDDDLEVSYNPEVGPVLDWSFAAREAGSTADKWIFSTNPDLTEAELNEIPTFQPGRCDFENDAGDFNCDGVVDMADFAIMAENFNLTFSVAESFSKGDETGDGTVDLADFLATRQVLEAQSAGAAASVPEPAALTLAVTVGAAAMLRRRHARRRRRPG
jgi:hypothetical protein